MRTSWEKGLVGKGPDVPATVVSEQEKVGECDPQEGLPPPPESPQYSMCCSLLSPVVLRAGAVHVTITVLPLETGTE